MKTRIIILAFYFISISLIGCKKDGNGERNNTPPYKPAPTNGSNYSCEVLRPTLSWICSDADGDALTYTLKFGLSSSSLGIKISNLSATEYTFNEELSLSQKYYWQVIANDGKNETLSDIWEFSTVSDPIISTVPSTPTIISPKFDSKAGNVQFIWSIVVDDGGLENITYSLNVNGQVYSVTGATTKIVNVAAGYCNWYVKAIDKEGNCSESDHITIMIRN